MDVANLLDWHAILRHSNMYKRWGLYAGEKQKQTPEARSPPRRGDIKPDSRRGARSEFQESEFFDPHDIVQVKYEMLRRVSVENAAVKRS
jgi:hypothetical protein